MSRYSDKIIILEAIGGDPYQEPTWRKVYEGRCRCFLHRESGYRIGKVMDCTHQVVIPDRNMVQIGENFKVGVKMHTNKDNRNWDLVGYVKDFARYDRVCNLFFQMVKENIIYEDVPGQVIDPEKRVLQVYDDEWFHIESTGLVESDIFMEDEVITMEFLRMSDAVAMTTYHPEFYVQDSEGEWVDITAQELFTEYQRKDSMNTVYVLVGGTQLHDPANEPYPVRIEIWTGPDKQNRGELVEAREITIMPKE